MTLIKWRGNDAMPSTFSNWIEDFFNESNVPASWAGRRSASPAVNVRETDKSFVLEVAAPGYKKDDFNISVENDLLTISSEQQNKVEDSDQGYTRREFSYSSFARSFTLPESVNADKIQGNYNNGILTIELPKKPEATKVKKTVKVS